MKTSPSILERMLAPIGPSLNEEAARKLIRLKPDQKTQARVGYLARQCNEGTLSSTERAEYERLVAAGNITAILQAQARRLLAGKH